MTRRTDWDKQQEQIAAQNAERTENAERALEISTEHEEILQKINDLNKLYNESGKSSLELAEQINEEWEKAGKLREDLIRLAQEEQRIIRQNMDPYKEARYERELEHKKLLEIKSEIESIRLVNIKKTDEEKEANLSRQREQQKFNDIIRDQIPLYHQIGRAASEAWTNATMRWNEAQKKWESNLLGRGGVTAGWAMTGQTSVASSVQSAIGNLSSLLPTGGGILGLLLHGTSKEYEWRAVGARISQQFEQLGEHTTKFGGQFQSMARTMIVNNIATEQELINVTGAMADMNVKSKEMMQTVSGLGKGFDNLLGYAIGIDKTFELAAGTTAKLAGSLSKGFGSSARESIDYLRDMSKYASDMGINFGSLSNMIVEASSAVRLMGLNMKDVGGYGLGFTKQMLGKFGPGRSAEAQEYAAGGFQSMMRGIGGMSIGMQAVIGEKIDSSKSGLEAAMALQDALGDNDPQKFSKMLGAIRDVIPGSTRYEKEYGAMKMFNLDRAGAKAMLDAENIGNLSPQQQKDMMKTIQTGTMSESQKTSEIVNILRRLHDSFAQVGFHLLGLIVNLLKMIAQGVMGAVNWLSDDKSRANDWFGAAGASGAQVGANFKNILNQFTKKGGIGSELGHLFGDIGGFGNFEPAYSAASEDSKLLRERRKNDAIASNFFANSQLDDQIWNILGHLERQTRIGGSSTFAKNRTDKAEHDMYIFSGGKQGHPRDDKAMEWSTEMGRQAGRELAMTAAQVFARKYGQK